MASADSSPTPSGQPPAAGLRELVVCSLEPWDEVWRRNQFFTEALLRHLPNPRVLYVEPPADPVFDLRSRRRPALPRLRDISPDGRLRSFRPLRALPRRIGRLSDRLLLDQVRLAARTMGFSRPTLWINDVTYAPLITRTGWPSLYDVTDDWLLADFPERELDRLRRLDALALSAADEVVVCSPALAESRGRQRAVSLITNAVDAEHFRRPRPRPRDLPHGQTAVYVGSLHDSRLDVELVNQLAKDRPTLSVVLVGPDSLEQASRARLLERPNVVILGSRPYEDVPAYLQHADVVIVPHLVSPFTETLDPIKAYECLAVDTLTVATSVAGFRDLADDLAVVGRNSFVTAVERALTAGKRATRLKDVPSWDEQGRAFERALVRATSASGVALPASAAAPDGSNRA